MATRRRCRATGSTNGSIGSRSARRLPAPAGGQGGRARPRHARLPACCVRRRGPFPVAGDAVAGRRPAASTRPLVLTAHDLLPREARPGQTRGQRRLYERVDGIVVHSQYGRAQLVDRLDVDPGRVHVIHHGAFDHLAAMPAVPLPAELQAIQSPVVLFFGLLRPYKGLETLLAAWRGIEGAELWIVGRPRMALPRVSDPSVRLIGRFVSDYELGAFFRRADVIVLPYSRTERLDFSGVLATALAFGRASVVSDIGGFSEVAEIGAARLVAPDDRRRAARRARGPDRRPGGPLAGGRGGAGGRARSVLVGRGRARDARAVPAAGSIRRRPAFARPRVAAPRPARPARPRSRTAPSSAARPRA